MMETISITIRDCNGKRHTIRVRQDNICSYIDQWRDWLEDQEILMVTVASVCIYSRLSCDAINWEDIAGFFA